MLSGECDDRNTRLQILLPGTASILALFWIYDHSSHHLSDSLPLVADQLEMTRVHTRATSTAFGTAHGRNTVNARVTWNFQTRAHLNGVLVQATCGGERAQRAHASLPALLDEAAERDENVEEARCARGDHLPTQVRVAIQLGIGSSLLAATELVRPPSVYKR